MLFQICIQIFYQASFLSDFEIWMIWIQSDELLFNEPKMNDCLRTILFVFDKWFDQCVIPNKGAIKADVVQ